MEPLNDKELNQLLRQWESPPAPSTLRKPSGRPRQSTWTGLGHWLWTGRIHVPVPVGALAVFAAVAIWIYSSRVPAAISVGPSGNAIVRPVTPPAPDPPSAILPSEPQSTPDTEDRKAVTASLSGFQPVHQLEPKILRVRP